MARVSFPELEKQVLKHWKDKDIFNTSLQKPSPKGEFVFYEGPPTANGKPGIHHVLARAFKDVVPRYKTMQGFHVVRKGGWDTHGLPVELQVEKELGISGKPDIEKYGIAEFNKKSKESVWVYKDEWEKFTERMGYWVDMDNPYVTYDNDYIESLWWIIKQVNDKGLLYKGHKVVPHCPRCGTALSSHEVAQGYKEVKDTSVYVKFKIRSDGRGQKFLSRTGSNSDTPVYILSWTTTPWTLPGNVGLAVGEKEEYYSVEVETSEVKRFKQGEILIFGRSTAVTTGIFGTTFNPGGLPGHEDDLTWAGVTIPAEGNVIFKNVGILAGKDLVGLSYEPLFPGAIPEDTEHFTNAYQVWPADFVTTQDGTGVVHTAVMYGEDDYVLGEEVGLPKYHTVSAEGKFNFSETVGVENLRPVHAEVLQSLHGMPVKHKDKPTEEKTTKLILDYLEEQGLLLKTEQYKHDYPFCWRCDTPLLYYAKDSWFIAMSKLRDQLKANNEQINWIPGHIQKGRFGEWLDGIKDWALSRERYWGTPLPVWECTDCDNRVVVGSREELQELSKQEIDVAALDLHRPYLDDIILTCKSCNKDMYRDQAVIDVWFDSGAMPFAQYHYPFEHKELIDGAGGQFPADYISEAIDQTRGWFYTLLAISTLLEKGPSYKNVICLAHINDKHGKKMSKSKGNVIDPWEMMELYGADSLRLLFYTMNQPGETKNFDPKQVEEILKKNWIVLWNVLSFYNMFAAEVDETAYGKAEAGHIMDKWIIERTKQLVAKITQELDEYDITTAGREIITFINELSTVYIQYSRDRFKSAETRAEAVKTLGQVLLTLSKVLAPFTPFIAESLYQELVKDCPVKDMEFKDSVHLEDWPEVGEVDNKILKQITTLEQYIEAVLSLRAEAGIKVRQPLSEVALQTMLDDELLMLLLDRVNVKEIVESGAVPDQRPWIQHADMKVALNTEISQELEREGLLRELVRQINALRKKAGLSINDHVNISILTKEEKLITVIDTYTQELAEATLADVIKQDVLQKSILDEEVTIDGIEVRIMLGQP